MNFWKSQYGAAIVRPNGEMPGREFAKSIWINYYKAKFEV